MKKVTIAALCGLVAGVTFGGSSAAAADPAKAARKCRGAIASAAKQVVQAGLGALDACHARRDAGKGDVDCNAALPGDAGLSRAQVRGTGLVGAACPPGNPVRSNYTDGDPAAVFQELTDALKTSGHDVQGLPQIASDRTERVSHAKCHRAIGKARSAIVKEIVKRSTACQKKLDKKAASFAALDTQCRVAASSAGRGAAGIAKACSGLTGADVASCSPLPDCVVADATETAREVAADVYGAFPCGDGIREGSEQCDDGNADDGDGCTNACTLPRCGDGAVAAGVERCDDGNRFDDDGCRNDCTLPVCGDGVVAKGVEECDDGNTDAGDGCGPDCKLESVTCDADGALASVVLVYKPEVVPGLGGVTVQLGYPPDRASLPGSGAAVAVRVTPADTSGIYQANDCDVLPHPAPTTPHTPCASSLTVPELEFFYVKAPDDVPPGPLFQVQFDCPAGDVLEPAELPCAVVDASDDVGNTIATDQLTCIVRLSSSAPATTTTVTIASTTTATATTTPVSTTTTSTAPHVCGNGTVEGPETCDDGNGVDETDPAVPTNPADTCPATCIIGACGAGTTTSQDVTVHMNAPGGSPALGGITVFLDYPDAKTSIPGSGSGVTGSIKNLPAGSLSSPNDLDYGLLEGIVNLGGISPGTLFTVTFANCPGAAPLAPGDFACVVKDASDTGGNTVPGVTCSVTIP
jgi:cysteine-rich repeat protein